MALSSQILLPLEDRRPDRFQDFIAGPNQPVVSALQELIDCSEGSLFIRGTEGSGKSHLLNATCNSAQEKGLQAFFPFLGYSARIRCRGPGRPGGNGRGVR